MLKDPICAGCYLHLYDKSETMCRRQRYTSLDPRTPKEVGEQTGGIEPNWTNKMYDEMLKDLVRRWVLSAHVCQKWNILLLSERDRATFLYEIKKGIYGSKLCKFNEDLIERYTSTIWSILFKNIAPEYSILRPSNRVFGPPTSIDCDHSNISN